MINTFARVKPCIAPGTHKFVVSWPPYGTYGYAQVVCERCGMTAKEARL